MIAAAMGGWMGRARHRAGLMLLALVACGGRASEGNATAGSGAATAGSTSSGSGASSIAPSCAASGPGMTDCGVSKESCCASLEVTGGPFYAGYDLTQQAASGNGSLE